MISALFQKANEYIGHEQLQLAWETFHEILEIEPQNWSALHGCGYVLLESDNVVESKPYLEAAIVQQTESAELYFHMGICHFLLDEYEAAIPFLERSGEMSESLNLSSYYLVNIGVRLNRLDILSRNVDRAMSLRIIDADRCNFIGMALHLLDRPKDSLEYFTRASRDNPQLFNVYYNIGVNCKALGMVEEAEAAYRLQEQKGNAPENLYTNLGILLEEQERYKEALLFYQSAVAKFGRKRTLLIGISNCYLELDRLEDARVLLGELVRRDQLDAEAQHNLGIVLLRLDIREQGLFHVKKALDLRPNYFNAHITLGEAYVASGQYDLAEALFLKALELDGDQCTAYQCLAFMYNSTGDFKKSIVAFEEVLKTGRQRSAAYSCLILLYGRALEIDKLVELYPKYLHDEPHEPIAYINSASALKHVGGEFDKVMGILETGLANIPGNPDILAFMGDLYAVSGATSIALEFLSTTTADHPDHLDANLSYAAVLLQSGDQLLAKKHLDIAETIDGSLEKVKVAKAQYLYYIGERVKAYDILIRLVREGTDTPRVFEMLSQVSEEINPERIKHFYRTLFEYEGFIGSYHLFDFNYLAMLEAPMLVDKLYPGVLAGKSIFSYEAVVEAATRKTRYFKRLFQVWKQTGSYDQENLLIEAIVYFYLGDPVHGYRIFSLEMEEEFLTCSPMAMYYFELCAVSTGIKQEFVIQYVKKLRVKTFRNFTDSERFYLALGHSLEGDYAMAIAILQEIKDSYPQARYQLVATYQKMMADEQSQNTDPRLSIVGSQEKLFKSIAELTLSEDLRPLYRYGLEPLHPGIDSENFLARILPVIHYFELSETLGAIFPISHEQETIDELIVLDELGQTGKGLKLMKDRIPEIYGRLVHADVDSTKFREWMHRCRAAGNLENFLSEQLYNGMSLEYFFEKDKYEKKNPFGFRFHLQLICELFSKGDLTFDQGINLLYYLHYGANRIPYRKENEVVTFFIDTLKELMVDSMAIPNLYFFQKIVQLGDIIRNEKKLKKPPLKSYAEFVEEMDVVESE